MGRVASSLTIVFPMWNEESSIHLAAEAAHEAGTALIESGEIDRYEVVIVDDASTDATGRLADELASSDHRVRVVHHDRNLGLGGSIKTGLRAATGDLVLYTDADLPCDLLESLTRATRLMRLYGADVVSAYRHDRTAEGPRRAVYSFAYNLLIRFGFKLRVRDVNFAFKLVRRPVLEHAQLDSEGSFIDAELLIRAHRLGFHIIQFGVDYFPRTRGISTLSSGSTIAKIVRELNALRPQLAAVEALPAAVLALAGADPEANPTEIPRRRHRRRSITALRSSADRGPHGMRLLIVNADDYGLTEAVSKGVLRAHRNGIVTSTSALVLAPGWTTSSKWLLDEDGLGVGVHLAAVGEDPPLLSAREVPTLVGRTGALASNWRVFLARAAAGRIDPADLAREFTAQLEAVREVGLTVTHLDTHQHLHLWPLVREVVLTLAAEAGIAAVRVPRSATRFPGAGVNLLAVELARRAAARGLVFPEAAAGLDEAGGMHGPRIEAALDRLGVCNAATVELSAHPGERDDPARARYRWNYAWEEELAALISPQARERVDRLGFTLANYADLAARQQCPPR